MKFMEMSKESFSLILQRQKRQKKRKNVIQYSDMSAFKDSCYLQTNQNIISGIHFISAISSWAEKKQQNVMATMSCCGK